MYNWYENEPHYEPTMSDIIIEEAKIKLMDVLSNQVKKDRDSVILENISLKKKNEELKQKVDEISKRENKLEIEKRNLKKTVRKEYLSNLLKDFQVERFKVDYKSMYGKKCNKCNDRRQIIYKSPLGKEQKELCDCAKDRVKIYFPESALCTEFKIDKNDRDKLRMWYTKNSYDDKEEYYSSSNYYEKSYNNEPYEDLNSYKIIFDTIEECQKYCDWLNKDINIEEYSEN